MVIKERLGEKEHFYFKRNVISVRDDARRERE
jgi:hypothetical protein